MIPLQELRKYPFFAGLKTEHITALAKSAYEINAGGGDFFFQEGDILDHFYLLLDGLVAIIIEIPDRDEVQTLTRQLTGTLLNREVIVSTITEGNIFGWSALVPPYRSTAGAKAQTDCRVFSFDCEQIRPLCFEDPEFGHLMTKKIAQVIRNRLRDMRIESLALSAV